MKILDIFYKVLVSSGLNSGLALLEKIRAIGVAEPGPTPIIIMPVFRSVANNQNSDSFVL